MANQPSFSDIQALIIDMDGVLWRGDTALPGIQALFERLRTRQMPFILATNNATKTQSQYVEKFAKFGVSMEEDRVMTSSLATAEYLKTCYSPGTRLHIIGQDGIRQAIKSAGFEIADTDVAAVVVGLDFELTYEKLRRGTMLINKGADFIGTNGDPTFPFEDGSAPGNGAILAAFTAATGQIPTLVGKPERHIFDMAIKKLGADPQTTAMLGDKLETDILGAKRANLKTILVLTGVSRADELAASEIKPDWVFSGIDELARHL